MICHDTQNTVVIGLKEDCPSFLLIIGQQQYEFIVYGSVLLRSVHQKWLSLAVSTSNKLSRQYTEIQLLLHFVSVPIHLELKKITNKKCTMF